MKIDIEPLFIGLVFLIGGIGATITSIASVDSLSILAASLPVTIIGILLLYVNMQK